MRKLLLWSVVGFGFILSGCAELHQGAREVGKPIGAVVRVPQAITEGAAEGFAPETDANPYGR